MVKTFCDVCGKEIDCRNVMGRFKGVPCTTSIQGGEFDFSVQYKFSLPLDLHGVQNKRQAVHTLQTCCLCAIEIIDKIDSFVETILTTGIET